MPSSYMPAGRTSEESIPLDTVYPNDPPPGHSFIARTDSFAPNDEAHLPRRALTHNDRRVASKDMTEEHSGFRRNNSSPTPNTLNNHTGVLGAPSNNPFTNTSYVSPGMSGSLDEMGVPPSLASPHVYGNNSTTTRRRGYTLEREDKSRLLNSVPEENSSDSSDDDETDTKDGMGKLSVQKTLNSLHDDSDSEHSSPQTPRRRGLRHYSRKDKKKKKASRSTRVAQYLRKGFVSLIRFSLIARCFFYWLPIALILFIPLSVGAWIHPDATLGEARMVWVFIWLEVVWASLWVSRLFASILPQIYKFLMSILAPGLKKYRSVLNAMEVPVSLVFWALVSLCTFMPIMTQKANATGSDATSGWQKTINNILVALLISSLVFFVERMIIHLISVSFHKTRFARRIKDNKQSIHTLSDLLYVACIPFPPFCPEFSEEDLQLQSGSFLKRKRGPAHTTLGSKLVSSHNLQKVIGRINHAIDFAAVALGKVARGQTLEMDDIRHWVNSIIADAMNSETLAEVLAMRIWMSLVVEGEEHLTIDDLVEVLGEDRKADAESIFRVLDIDGNGNLTSDEMISAVVEICHEHRSVYKSLKDVDSAIQKLHNVLLFIVLIIIIVVFVGFLAPSFSTVLATLGTSIIALSFVFSTTAQEITASCVFLFVKHPIDVGDRVDIFVSGATSAFFVKEISLLYTVFTRVMDEAVVQAPNSVLNTLWIENVSRSGPMTYTFKLTLGVPETNFDQIDDFKDIMNQYCLDNSRDYQANPFISCTELPDLDRVTLTCAVTFRSNFADGKLYSMRRNKLIQFLGRTIYDLKISIPRREDTSTDPGLPLHLAPTNPFLGASSDAAAPSQNSPVNPFETPLAGVPDITNEVAATQKALFPRQRALVGFGPSKADLVDLNDNVSLAGEGAATVDTETITEDVLAEQPNSSTFATVRRNGTQVSRALTMASRSSGVSRRLTMTGRRHRD